MTLGCGSIAGCPSPRLIAPGLASSNTLRMRVFSSGATRRDRPGVMEGSLRPSAALGYCSEGEGGAGAGTAAVRADADAYEPHAVDARRRVLLEARARDPQGLGAGIEVVRTSTWFAGISPSSCACAVAASM